MTRKELKRLLKNHTSSGDKVELLNWLLTEKFDDELEQFITEDLTAELLNSHTDNEIDADVMISRILSKAGKAIKREDQQEIEAPMGRQRRLGWIYRVAATLLILGMFGAIAYYFSGTKKNVEPAVSTVIKENLRGRKSTIFLNDGSIVYLNSESSIEYPEKFSDSLRVVKISGEAFFDIARDEHKPFIVHTDELAISVLGTSFNVNDFDENDRCKISLSSGKVSVSTLGQAQGDTADAIILNPGQCVSYLEEKAEFTSITAFDPNLDLGWKDGNIVFKNADMQTMLKTFERWYNVDFKLKNDPYFRWSYTGEFHNQTLQDVLESLSFSQSFDFRFEENNVELMFKPN